MLRTEKQSKIDDIRARFDRMTSAVFLDFTGMTVAEVSRLRDQFRAKGVDKDGRPAYEDPVTVTKEITVTPKGAATVDFELK